MTRLLREILKVYLCSSAVLFLLSLSSLTPQVSMLLQGLTFPALAMLCILRVFSPPRISRSLLFPWLVTLLLWFCFQQAAIMLAIPPFEVSSNWRTWVDFFSLFMTAAAYALVAEEIFSDREDLYSFLKFFVFSSGCCAVYFIFLFYTCGVAVEKIQPPFVLLEHLGPLGALSLQPNNLVDLFVPPLFFGLALVFYHHRRKLHFSDPSRAYTEIVLNLCFACVLLAGVFYTKSRAGIIAFLGGFVFFAVLFALAQRRRKGTWKIVALVFVAGLVFLSTLGMKDVFHELMTLKETFSREAQIKGLRSLTMGASWQLVVEKGFWGVGLGNFPMGWLLFHKHPFTVYPYRSYNDLLWFWAETGLPGLFILLGLLLKGFVSAFKSILRSQSSFVAYLASACLASISVFTLHAVVDPTLYVNTLLWQIAIVLGVIGALRHLEAEETRDKRLGIPKHGNPLLRATMAIALLFMAAPVTYFSCTRLMALSMVSSEEINVANLEKVTRLEITSSFYPRQLALAYAQQYAQDPSKKAVLDQAVKAMDAAIERDPFNVSLYRGRAELFGAAGDMKNAEQSLRMMEERLPNFYLGAIAAMAFYLDESLKEKDAVKANRYKAQALRQYLRALELNPRLIKYFELYPSLSEDAQQALQALLEEKSLS